MLQVREIKSISLYAVDMTDISVIISELMTTPCISTPRSSLFSWKTSYISDRMAEVVDIHTCAYIPGSLARVYGRRWFLVKTSLVGLQSSPDTNNWLIGKDPDAGKDWWQEEKGTTEDEMVGWHHWFDGHELEQAPGAGDGQGGLACCSPWGHKVLDVTKWLNWTDRALLWVHMQVSPE